MGSKCFRFWFHLRFACYTGKMKATKCFILIGIVLLKVFHCESANCSLEPKTTEARLKKKLLCSYDTSERPVINPKDTVTVNLHLVLQNFDFDEATQKLYLNVWFLMVWMDAYLKWDSRDYENIKQFITSPDDIWTPDLTIYSSYNSDNLDQLCSNPKCIIDRNGTVFCVPSCSYNAICVSDFTRWPYDTQNCTLRFGMWAESGSEIDFESNVTSLGSNMTNKHSQWKIVSATVSKIVEVLGVENKTFPTIIYNYILERHSGTHSVVLISPALIMIAINLMTCWLRVCSTERIVLLGTNVFTHFTLLQHLFWYAPYNGASVPTVLIFFRDSLVISAVLLLMTVIFRYLSNCESNVPVWIETVTESIAANSAGQCFCTSNYLDRQSKQIDPNQVEDAVNLVEDSPKISCENMRWRQFTQILDRLLFLIVFLTYFIMIILLLPENYASSKEYSLTIDGYMEGNTA